MKRVAIHQPLLFPWLGLFHKWASADLLVIHEDCQFKYKEWQNRFAVLCDGKRQILTASFLKGDKWKPINEVTLRGTADLAHKLRSYYRTTLHQYELDAICEVLESGDERPLLGVALQSMILIAAFLKVSVPTVTVGDMSLEPGLLRNDKVIAICQATGTTNYLSGTGARKYNDDQRYKDLGIELEYQRFECQPYHQRAVDEFVPGLSAVDAILHIGSEAASRLVHEQVPNGVR